MPTATEPTLTARAAYDCDGDVKALVDVWVSERRCPLVLVDRLLELGLPTAAECARWAATEPEQKSYGATLRNDEHPYPCQRQEGTPWYWFDANPYRMQESRRRQWCNEVFAWQVKGTKDITFASALDAILWLLGNWKLPA